MASLSLQPVENLDDLEPRLDEPNGGRIATQVAD